MNRLLKFLYRFQNQRRIHKAPFWTVVKMAWAQSGRTRGYDSSIVCHEVIDIEYDYDNFVDDNYTITDIPFGIALNSCKKDEYVKVILNCNHEYEYSNGSRKCLKCGKENRYYLKV